MGIVDTITRSKDDFVKPKKKSYWGYKISVELVSHKDISEKIKLLPSEKRAVAHELSGREPIEEVILLHNTKKTLGRLTTFQVKEILDDIGFNVDTILSGAHFSDFSAVMNINGFAIPGWVFFVRIFARLFPSAEKLLLLKLSPGRDRLHIRAFEMNDGTWMFTAHTDHNWMSLNLPKVFKSHIYSGGPVGSGDYITGTIMMNKLLKEFAVNVTENKIFKYEEVENIIKWGYAKSLKTKLNKVLKPTK